MRTGESDRHTATTLDLGRSLALRPAKREKVDLEGYGIAGMGARRMRTERRETIFKILVR
jgi:hypothetical protein